MNRLETEKTKIKRLGEICHNLFGTCMKIIEYNSATNIIVEFQDEHMKKIYTTYDNFKIGNLTNLYDKNIFGLGFIGYGQRVSDNMQQFKTWYSMMLRCYDEKNRHKHITYKNCSVYESWYNFQNFIPWYNQNYYQISTCRMCLDKDILYKGNKIYSSENCVFVPNEINALFCKANKIRGNLPIGVSFHKASNKYRASCFTEDKSVHLGLFDNPLDAFNTYKKYKENRIKSIALEYKDKIPVKLYNAMMNYEVEITD